MTVAINTTTALAATNDKTESVLITKGNFKLVISGVWTGTVTILRRPQRINTIQYNNLVHSGAANAAALTAVMTGVVADELIGMWVRNTTTGKDSFGLITDNTASVITATLSGTDDWDVGDTGEVWEVSAEYTSNQDLIGEEAEDNAQFMAIFTKTTGTARVTISR